MFSIKHCNSAGVGSVCVLIFIFLLLDKYSEAGSQLSTDSRSEDQLSRQCGIPGTGNSDPFGLAAQFTLSVKLPPAGSTVLKALTSSISISGNSSSPDSTARDDWILPPRDIGTTTAPFGSNGDNRETVFTAVKESGGLSGSAGIFLTGFGPNVQDLIDSTTGTTEETTDTTIRRQVIPRILKREIAENKTKFGSFTSTTGGRNALLNEICWQAQITTTLRISTGRFATITCGGTIIGASTILTAAHCVVSPFTSSNVSESFLPDEISVLLGGRDSRTCATSSGANTSAEWFGVKKVIRHADYNSVLADNDIALVILDRPIDLASKSFACSICLKDKAPPVDELCIASGTGDDIPNMVKPHLPLKWVLLRVRQPSTTTSTCGFNVDDISGKTTNANLFVCAGGDKGQDSCQGDSGGPLVCFDKSTSSHYLAGVGSFGPPCGINIGAMYAKVANYLTWIIANTGADVALS